MSDIYLWRLSPKGEKRPVLNRFKRRLIFMDGRAYGVLPWDSLYPIIDRKGYQLMFDGNRVYKQDCHGDVKQVSKRLVVSED